MATIAVQTTLDDLGTPLRDVTFCVVDLETTGGRADDLGITEIGAVSVRGGEILGEFQTLAGGGVRTALSLAQPDVSRYRAAGPTDPAARRGAQQ